MPNFRLPFYLAIAALTLVSPILSAQSQTGNDWPMYHGDLTGRAFSPLRQIDSHNVQHLELAWSHTLRKEGDLSANGPNSQATPIVVNSVMYLPVADGVQALDPISGAILWHYTLDSGTPSRRGVAYWDGEGNIEPRIIFTTGSQLFAIEARTGYPALTFGDNGSIELGVPFNSVPLIYKNIVVVGANTPRGAVGGIGNARAFDLRNSEKLWEFDSVAQPEQIGHDTWEQGSWKDRLGANAWPFYFTMDEAREHVYLPLAAPIPFAYGGDRDGANLFANSLVAVDINTGEYIWHYQTIHHDIWDHDPPAPPVLFDFENGNESVAALGLTTKSGYLYILDRDTGIPLFDTPETLVPKSIVPGENTFPTQPIPQHPPALARTHYTDSDLVSAEQTSADHERACQELINTIGDIHNEGAFTPWTFRDNPESINTTLLFPGLVGGPNWGGASFDPVSGLVFVFSQDIGSFGWIEANETGSEPPFTRKSPRTRNFDVDMNGSRWPCQSPPWSNLSAVDPSTGDIVWQTPVGITEGLPAQRQNTGRPGRAGAITTASGLLFIASTDDKRFRAIDTQTGKELWVTKLPRQGNASPMTYLGKNAKQYIVIVAIDSVMAFSLP